METWQFSLFFAALLVGYVVIHVRVARFEAHLRELSHLKSIDQRLEGLAKQVAVADEEQFGRIEKLLERLHEDLEELRETTATVGESVVKLPQMPAAAAADGNGVSSEDGAMHGGSVGSPSDRIRTIVESRLLQLGYTRLRLLTDLSDVSLDRDVEVRVECERGHMPAKGRVMVRNGAIYDVAMQTVATTFP